MPALAGGPLMTDRAGWRAIHLLAPDCGCSLTIARHLKSRGRVEGLDETVVLMGAASELQPVLKAADFAIELSAAAAVERKYGIVGGPWLLLIRPDGRIAYSGGYAPVRVHDGVRFQDLAIWERCRTGQSVDALPAFGCAASEQLQKALDPLQLKYFP